MIKMSKIKTKEQIIKKYKQKLVEQRKLSKSHLRCKGINKSGYVTNKEHISGERLSSVEGFLFALDWVLNESDKFWEDLIKK